MLSAADPAVPPGTTLRLSGLSATEVAERVEQGRSNRQTVVSSRSLGQILARNTFTWLNLLLGVLGAATLATGAGPDATFLSIAVINTVIGAVQEVRAKRTLESLSVISAPRVRVVRDGSPSEIAVEDLVVDDVMQLRSGDQVVVDAVIVADRGELDESLATGESDPVAKGPGDALLSGSWMVSGALTAQVTGVGSDTYAGRLAAEARQFSLGGSELVAGVNRILRWLSVVMVIVGPVLLVRQLQLDAWRPAVRATVAGLVGMVPEGLVLLTTLAFLRAAVRLSRRRVLVQELPAVEGLARVDALCTDKTGTLTEGRVEWAGLVVASGADPEAVTAGLGALAGVGDANPTLAAVRAGVAALPGWRAPGWQPSAEVAFNSSRKWSGATFPGEGTWVLGAPEMVTARDPADVRARVADLAERGSRVLVVARGDVALDGVELPSDLELVGVVELQERLRPDATTTLEFFAAQGVTVRVVSGDSPATVAAVSRQVGLPGADLAIDARTLPDDDPEGLADAMEANRVFGRVTPEQKRAMVGALRAKGHVVAMTGDGVNDTLALKDADLGIAMGSGSPVARGVAQLVLLDDQFEVLPEVVAEGRQVLRNIERVAWLFLVKNVYSVVLSVAVAAAGWTYPFLPRHLTLISGLGIGIPGFFLALAPASQRFEPGFVRRVLRFSIPGGVVTAGAILASYGIVRHQGGSVDQSRTMAVAVTAGVSVLVVVLAARPLQAWKVAMAATLAVAFFGAFTLPGINRFFNVEHRPGASVMAEVAAVGLAACALVVVVTGVTAAARRSPTVAGGGRSNEPDAVGAR